MSDFIVRKQLGDLNGDPKNPASGRIRFAGRQA
jgi:hypothetical protein